MFLHATSHNCDTFTLILQRERDGDHRMQYFQRQPISYGLRFVDVTLTNMPTTLPHKALQNKKKVVIAGEY